MCQQTQKCKKTLALETFSDTGVQTVLSHQCGTTPWVHTSSCTWQWEYRTFSVSFWWASASSPQLRFKTVIWCQEIIEFLIIYWQFSAFQEKMLMPNRNAVCQNSRLVINICTFKHLALWCKFLNCHRMVKVGSDQPHLWEITISLIWDSIGTCKSPALPNSENQYCKIKDGYFNF